MRVRRSPSCDPQRERVYAMENTFMASHMHYAKADMRTLRRVSRAACELYGVKPPTLIQGRNKRIAGQYDSVLEAVWLFKRGMNSAVLLHELAHHIDDAAFDSYAAPHGPRFAAIEMDLLDKLKVLPSDAFRLLARRFGVRIGRIDRATVKRRMVRRRKAR